ncbi:hydrolase Nlp/P60 [Burkholderia sp. WAC0059]|uniref:NlpC/P60 family protein n=1 Tax=Burkholderia sp. WAC0059 TaxID=2066022 RepID=UPI000C7EB0B9|nr:NlpC/P60 family protein [Burkholderia sp. WAC0059]PLZ03627.1 hydrolase Nlp/P60 [Burkholderia sp. WAC0059]
MRRLWLPLLLTVLLAACSSAPPRVAYNGGSDHGSIMVPRAYRTVPPGFPDFVDHSIGREEISIEAMGLVGIPYRWGGNTPESGFDCSGLVKYVVARAAMINLPRTTSEMRYSGVAIQPDEIAAGDLVFFDTDGRPYSHVGIYVGQLRFVDAPSTGGTVRLDYLNNPYWARHFNGIRRVAPPKRAPSILDAPTYEASAPPSPPPGTDAAAIATASVAPSSPSPARSDTPPPGQTPVAEALPPDEATTVSAAPTAVATDPFEPPPDSMRSAQVQAREADAVSPASGNPAAQTAQTAPSTASSSAPDAIDAAADAYEPPPPSASAASRQAAEAQAAQPSPIEPLPSPADAPPQILRASTSARELPPPSSGSSNDDPIARFANGNFQAP